MGEGGGARGLRRGVGGVFEIMVAINTCRRRMSDNDEIFMATTVS